MTIYITHSSPGRDYTPAKQYGGEIVVVFSHAVFPDFSPLVMGRLTTEAANKLQSFNVELDYVLLSGAPEAIALCSSILCYRHGHFTALKWDRDGFYYPIEISIERIRNGQESAVA